MHLSFELNRMIPVHFLCTEGNYSEKAFLRDVVEKGQYATAATFRSKRSS